MPSSDAPTIERRADEHPAITEPIDDRAEDERADENAKRQQGGERADRAVVELESLGQHVVDRAEREKHDAEQQHPQTGGGEDEVLVVHGAVLTRRFSAQANSAIASAHRSAR